MQDRPTGIAAASHGLASDAGDRLTPEGPDYEAMTKEDLLDEARNAGIEGPELGSDDEGRPARRGPQGRNRRTLHDGQGPARDALPYH
jgi:hypothetical protein